jgi:Ca2+-binding RTX toxin-like protein
MASIAVPFLAGPARASHDGPLELEVSPDVQTIDFGINEATLTARLGQNAAAETQIDFENQNDANGASYASPDASCTIPADQRVCTITIPRGTPGSHLWRAWIDQSPPPAPDTSPEVDLDEERISNPTTDCAEPEDAGASCTPNPLGNDQVANPGDGQACDLLTPPIQEPDCTDVVRITWGGEPSVETTLDCDDPTGPNTEKEVAAPGDEVTYTCVLRDQFGGVMTANNIFGEVENGTNDPDVVDGASYNTPDYDCSPTGSGNNRVCEADVSDVENDLGTSEICWWFGDAAAGASLCGSEPTGENQNPDGSDEGNDLADQTELTYEDPETYLLDCDPETGTSPATSDHEVTCTVTSPTTQQTIGGQAVDVEVTGAGDPEPGPAGDSPEVPDLSCTTGDDGSCTVSHSSDAEGVTTYRAWITLSALAVEADTDEAQNENLTPGSTPEPDNTDVVTNTWGPEPEDLSISPKSDTAEVGECNPYTITITHGTGDNVQGTPGVTVDVEQIHATATDQSAGNEPTVSFCLPASGANPSMVDTTRGDLGPNSANEEDKEDPDNAGTAGGETEGQTDNQGRITIGIAVDPGQGSNGSGSVNISAFFDSNNNDDANSGEPQDQAIKSWTEGPQPGGHTIDCRPNTASTPTDEEHVVTCTVRDPGGASDPGKGVDFTEEGQGEIVSAASGTTDANGEISVSVASDATGEQTITGTLSDANSGEPDTDECDEPGGNCSDSVTNTWVEPRDTCPGFRNDARNQVVGTPGDDTLRGTNGNDIICGLGGDDQINGRGGNDLILGGGGNDTVSGGKGRDRIKGGGGNDELKGNGGKDTVLGGRGKDLVAGNAHNDTLKGGKGNDVLKGGKGNDLMVGGPGRDRCRGGPGRDRSRGCEA